MDNSATSITLRAAVDEFYYTMLDDPNYSPVTAEFYRLQLQRINKDMGYPRLADINRPMVTKYLGSLKARHCSSATIQRYWTIIRAFYNWASREYPIKRPDNIAMPHAVSKPVMPFTPDECKLMIAASGRLRNKVMLMFLLDTGTRVSEMCRVLVKHINLDNLTLEIMPFTTDIKSRPRYVHFGTSTRAVLVKLINQYRLHSDDPLFCNLTTRQPISRFSVNSMMERLSAKTRIADIHPHRFRHTFAIMYILNGGDVFTLQTLLGHVTLKQSREYAHIAQHDTAQVHRRASPVDHLRIR